MISVFRPQIQMAAQAHRLDPKLLEAMVWTESSDRPDAFRFEYEFYQTLKKLPTLPYMALGPLAACSYGLLQCLFVTCYEMGFKGAPEKLFVPVFGLEWGAKILAERFDWADGDPDMAIASYNVGKGHADRPFSVVAEAYLSKVHGFEAQLD